MADDISTFVYVTYIRTTPEALWRALTTTEFMKSYWFGVGIFTDWRAGSPWTMKYPDGTVTDSGEIVALDPPKRIVLKWLHEMRPEWKAEGPATCTIDIEPQGDAVKLTINHTIARARSKLIGAVSGGWPRILSNLKSLLETGNVLLK